jgi:hypothetical protein
MEMEMEKIERGQGLGYLEYFSDFKWNFLPRSILEGHHGDVWVDQDEVPNLVVLSLPKIKLLVLGGDPAHQASRRYIKSLKGMAGFFPVSEGWVELLREFYKGKLWELERYAYLSEALDPIHLRRLSTGIKGGYSLARLDLALTEKLVSERSEFTTDHLVNFDSTSDFIERGFGWCAIQEDRIVSVATTFLICSQGIEIQINTREEHQGKGLATVVAAKLMVESLERGLIPNWDAANKKSGGLAVKLGCVPQGTYTMYVNMGSKFLVGVARWGMKIKKLLGK